MANTRKEMKNGISQYNILLSLHATKALLVN